MAPRGIGNISRGERVHTGVATNTDEFYNIILMLKAARLSFVLEHPFKVLDKDVLDFFQHAMLRHKDMVIKSKNSSRSLFEPGGQNTLDMMTGVPIHHLKRIESSIFSRWERRIPRQGVLKEVAEEEEEVIFDVRITTPTPMKLLKSLGIETMIPDTMIIETVFGDSVLDVAAKEVLAVDVGSAEIKVDDPDTIVADRVMANDGIAAAAVVIVIDESAEDLSDDDYLDADLIVFDDVEVAELGDVDADKVEAEGQQIKPFVSVQTELDRFIRNLHRMIARIPVAKFSSDSEDVADLPYSPRIQSVHIPRSSTDNFLLKSIEVMMAKQQAHFDKSLKIVLDKVKEVEQDMNNDLADINVHFDKLETNLDTWLVQDTELVEDIPQPETKKRRFGEGPSAHRSDPNRELCEVWSSISKGIILDTFTLVNMGSEDRWKYYSMAEWQKHEVTNAKRIINFRKFSRDDPDAPLPSPKSGEYLEMKNCFYFLLNSQCFIVEIAIFFNIAFKEEYLLGTWFGKESTALWNRRGRGGGRNRGGSSLLRAQTGTAGHLVTCRPAVFTQKGRISFGYKTFMVESAIEDKTYNPEGIALFWVQGFGPENMQAIQVNLLFDSDDFVDFLLEIFKCRHRHLFPPFESFQMIRANGGSVELFKVHPPDLSAAGTPFAGGFSGPPGERRAAVHGLTTLLWVLISLPAKHGLALMNKRSKMTAREKKIPAR
ncbi:Villin-4 [Platanthera guangdongensis]|uniref:Villin-4 n=1 Tax=Platanthera guangdongensis TaxID=2320717 RepID=A0ABR2MZ40_9ASPA